MDVAERHDPTEAAGLAGAPKPPEGPAPTEAAGLAGAAKPPEGPAPTEAAGRPGTSTPTPTPKPTPQPSLPRPLRVAQVMGKMNGGGVEVVVMNYYRHIDRSAVQFDFIVDDDSKMVPRREIEALGGRVFTVAPIARLAAHDRDLRRLFQGGEWQLVHSHRNALSVFPLRVAKRSGIPVRIAHNHSTSGSGERLKNCMKNALRRFSNVYPTDRLACSRHAGEWLFGTGARFEVLPNAFDLEAYSYSAKTRQETREELGLGRDCLAVGHVGRFMPQKNQAFLLKSFERLLALRPDAVLVLVGDGSQKPAAQRWVREHGLDGQVRFLGHRQDAHRWYQAFDVFALPSLYEGLGIVGVEAQRAGLPCLVSTMAPHEIDVTGHTKFVDIVDPGLWAQELAKTEVGRRLAVVDEDFALYDISAQAPALVAYYQHLYRGIYR